MEWLRFNADLLAIFELRCPSAVEYGTHFACNGILRWSEAVPLPRETFIAVAMEFVRASFLRRKMPRNAI